MHSIANGRVVTLTEPEELAATATKPGEFAKHLENKHGLARRFAPVDAYFVNLDKVERLRLVEMRGSGLEYIGPAAYALTEDGRLLPSMYLFPVARHCKPRLATLRDVMGHYQQWVAPLKSNVKGPWE